jgi:pyruvate dehydrogenase E1 component alpha subunit
MPPDRRPPELIAHWEARDPIPGFESYLQERGFLSAEQMADIGLSIDQDLVDAVAFADASPYPAPEEALDDVFAPPSTEAVR